jgi:hypothetical protein
MLFILPRHTVVPPILQQKKLSSQTTDGKCCAAAVDTGCLQRSADFTIILLISSNISGAHEFRVLHSLADFLHKYILNSK